MDIVEFLGSRDGAATAKSLYAAGFTRRDLAKAISGGAVFRLHRGVYVSRKAAPDVVAAFRANGKLTCVSAARFYRLWTLNSDKDLHLSCGTGLARHRVVHHGQCIHPGHLYLPVAGVGDVLLHAMRCLPELESLVMVQSAVSQALLTTEFLEKKMGGNRNGKARAILNLVLPRADSLLEVLAHTHFTRAGLRVKMHADIPKVGEVDCLIEDCVIVELDGGTHFKPKQVKKDWYRSNAALRSGFMSLHYYYEDVVYRPQKMVDEVLAVLRNRETGRYGPFRYIAGPPPS
ncbi:DUF559 domain-containing protein [Paenarthrobacter nicotinovorans]|uniref:DUF559 domain-containing protein n=1 Tax=Paenarthrobacter nicotinovorans TaxID=29320 RepID=UPI0038237FCF